MRSIYEAPNYAGFSTLPLFPPSWVQKFLSTSFLHQPQINAISLTLSA